MVDSSVWNERFIDFLVAEMDLTRKADLLSGASYWSTKAMPEIRLDRMVLSDGPVGVRGEIDDERRPSLCLPSPTAMAATWDVEIVRELATLLAAEARQKGVHVLLGPTINLHRSPLGGRHFECLSEDPLLTARIAVAYVTALQRYGIGATPKHYVCNDSETERMTVDVRVDDRTLRELYLAPFEEVVSAGCWLVMSAYNSVNGETMSSSGLLSAPLKSEWGFDGVVVSDWHAVRSTVRAGRGGNDLAMPGPSAHTGPELVNAVRNGLVSEEVIDDKVRRILRLAGRVGALGGVTPPPRAEPGTSAPADVLRTAVARSMVLLRNEGDLLPVESGTVKRIAVIGPNSAEGAQIRGGGSSRVVPAYSVSPLAGIERAVAAGVEVSYCVGAWSTEGISAIPPGMLKNARIGGNGVHVQFLDDSGQLLRTEDRFSSQLAWEGEMLAGVARIVVGFHLSCREDGVHELGVVNVAGLSSYQLKVDGEVVLDQVVSPDQDPAVAMHDLDPVAVEVKAAAGQPIAVEMACVLNTKHSLAVLCLGVSEPLRPEHELLAEAVEAAGSADLAVVVVGNTAAGETEGKDRTDTALPGNQDQLVREVAKVNTRTVVVVNSGAPVDLEWREEVPAILVAWFPGQEFGNGLADVLFGHAEPGGRLPCTWAVRGHDAPVTNTKPANGLLRYEEGLDIGYRAWAQSGHKPAYAFGHGLGFTEWRYESLRVPSGIRAGESMSVRVRVRNVGRRLGRGVVQVYLRRRTSSVRRPPLWLGGFAPVVTVPGKCAEVEIEVTSRAFQHWSVSDGRWETELGEFEIVAGSSSVDLPLSATVDVKSGTEARS